MGDCLRTGKPLRRITRHPDLLSLSHPSMGMRYEYQEANAERVTGTSRDTLACIRGLAVCADVWT